MIVIGEKLNSAVPNIRELINAKNTAAVQDLALKQAEAGADYLDLNTAQGDELPNMEWIVNVVQEVTDLPLCIDSTSARAVKTGLDAVKGDKGRVLVNSISLEKSRLDEMLPLVLECRCRVIGLTVDDNGIPKTIEDRIRLTDRLVDILAKKNYDLSNLYIDPLVLPLAVHHANAGMFFECIREIKCRFNVKTISGLSNISFNMPMRKVINRYFLSIGMASGMDAAILDPLDNKIMTAVRVTDLLLGNDRFGKNYLKLYRSGVLTD
ncbi:MAG: methyltetrahydrofolate--corrinoid methyltransferase [Firmicutes bacterium HGW-Firmicutes-14]|nr:MAG: methyltetrahydrofolate--corrinoid methyltransferase [Firmicutes bacterium HGW-Firmicutes-14]